LLLKALEGGKVRRTMALQLERLRTLAALVLLGYATVQAVRSLPKGPWRLEPGDSWHELQQLEADLKPLREALPARGAIGYARLQCTEPAYDTAAHYRLQYALAPVLLDVGSPGSYPLRLVEELSNTPECLSQAEARRPFARGLVLVEGARP
jgi:hypothetical protein